MSSRYQVKVQGGVCRIGGVSLSDRPVSRSI